ncbi:hypothetical protein Golax_002417, partial [Gossypium laxum]|nr:hypothetical protein [Gossypium laxum]
VQIHDLPSGLFSENVAEQFENFIGLFEDDDAKHISRRYNNILRIRVRVDVQLPLKPRKKIMISPSNHIYAKFQYKKLTLFCFLCGCLRHRDLIMGRANRPGPKTSPKCGRVWAKI